MYAMFGLFASSVGICEGERNTSPAETLLNTFFNWPYEPSTCNSALVGGFVNRTMTSTVLELGRSGATRDPARARLAPANRTRNLKDCFISFLFPLFHSSSVTPDRIFKLLQ